MFKITEYENRSKIKNFTNLDTSLLNKDELKSNFSILRENLSNFVKIL